METKKALLPAVNPGLAASTAGVDAIGRYTPWGYAKVPNRDPGEIRR